jgi:hypothetical protein
LGSELKLRYLQYLRLEETRADSPLGFRHNRLKRADRPFSGD